MKRMITRHGRSEGEKGREPILDEKTMGKNEDGGVR